MSDLHAGPIMDKIDGLERHCETVYPNSNCPYIKLGCRGCTLKRYISQRLPFPLWVGMEKGRKA